MDNKELVNKELVARCNKSPSSFWHWVTALALLGILVETGCRTYLRLQVGSKIANKKPSYHFMGNIWKHMEI